MGAVTSRRERLIIIKLLKHSPLELELTNPQISKVDTENEALLKLLQQGYLMRYFQ